MGWMKSNLLSTVTRTKSAWFTGRRGWVMPIQPGTHKIGSTRFEGRKKYARAVYDFDSDGGSQGDITLTTTPTIPNGSLVTEAVINVTAAVTAGASGTLALKLESAADVNSADDVTGAPWSTTGVKRADALVGADSGVLTTDVRSVVATVATADLTAGAFDVVVEYMELS